MSRMLILSPLDGRVIPLEEVPERKCRMRFSRKSCWETAQL